MLTVIILLAGTALFMPFVLLAGRSPDIDKRMLTRLAMLQSGGSGGLTPGPDVDLLKSSGQTSSGRLEPVFARVAAALHLKLLLHQADSQGTAKRLLLLCVGSGTVSMLFVFLMFPVAPLALIAGAGASYLPVAVLKLRRNRRIDRMNKVLPDVIDMMARALRAGHSVAAAIGIIAEQAAEPARAEFSELFRKQQFGLPLRDALMEMLERVPSQDLRVLVAGILVQRDTGGNLTQILDRTAAIVRERLKLQGEIRVHTAQGRMTGWILCLLPVVMLVLINLVDPGYSKPLTQNPLGRKCLCAGVALLAVGAFLIRRIVSNIEV